MNVADVETSSAVDAGPPSHKFFKKDVISKSDVEDTVDGEFFEVLVELSSGSGEAVEDDSLGRFWLLDFFVDDLDNDVVADKASGLDNAPNGFDKVFIKTATDCTLEYFSDLITGGDVVVAEVFAEELGVGALADSGGPEEEEKLLLVAGEVLEYSGGESKHQSK